MAEVPSQNALPSSTSALVDLAEFNLYHPKDQSKTLEAAIDMGERAIDLLTDPLRGNAPELRPDIVRILQKNHLIDYTDNCLAIDAHNQNLDVMNRIKDELTDMDSNTQATWPAASDYIQNALANIDNQIVEPLRVQLKGAEGHLGVKSGNSGARLEMRLIGSIEKTIFAVQSQVDDVNRHMSVLANQINTNTPDYKQGYRDGVAASGSGSGDNSPGRTSKSDGSQTADVAGGPAGTSLTTPANQPSDTPANQPSDTACDSGDNAQHNENVGTTTLDDGWSTWAAPAAAVSDSFPPTFNTFASKGMNSSVASSLSMTNSYIDHTYTSAPGRSSSIVAAVDIATQGSVTESANVAMAVPSMTLSATSMDSVVDVEIER
ncbi:hypothetical protein ACQP1G_20215 [Nocardia sp. CA-107356]|uniref:hypothetical protein n=1 Tax=Nocardia sp. CA-107356 TaxID=3239972 RepID=UPI003D930029